MVKTRRIPLLASYVSTRVARSARRAGWSSKTEIILSHRPVKYNDKKANPRKKCS